LFTPTLFCHHDPCCAGGAIVSTQTSSVTFEQSTCTNNTSKGNGGCFHTTGQLDCRNSTISGNKAALGGGLYIDFKASPYITNSHITDNTAEQSGGAWFGADRLANLMTDDLSIVTNNNAACCYVSGYGSTLHSNSTSTMSRTCADVDSGM
jgi:hypothetical protein